MEPKSLPPHIEKLCHDWHRGEDDIFMLWNGFEFDPAGVILEIERRKDEVQRSERMVTEKEAYYAELVRLKRYVINLVQTENRRQQDANPDR